MSKSILSFIKEITWLTGCETGWGNGYVAVPPKHPWHGKDYDSINIDIHGGLTFAASATGIRWPEVPNNIDDYWIVGFDCAHYGDNLSTCPKEFVETETQKLLQKAKKAWKRS